MAIDWNDEIVDQLEWHWQHQLRPRLDGLTDDEYFWQPVPDCWTISRRGESSAPVSVGAGDFTIDSADEPVSPEARLVMYTHLEVIHHGAEICLLRDLYREKFR
jgi:hypothetical protein